MGFGLGVDIGGGGIEVGDGAGEAFCGWDWVLFLAGEFDDEAGTFADGAFDADSSAVGFDDIFAGVESESGTALPCFIGSTFGGVVGVEDFCEFVLWDTGSVVADTQVDTVVFAVMGQSNNQLSAVAHCLPGVDQEVEENLLDLVSDRGDFWQAGFDLALDADSILLQFSFEEDHRFIDELLDVGKFKVFTSISRHSEDGVCNFGGALSRGEDFVEGFLAGFGVLLAQSHFGVVEDGHQHVVKFVGGGADQFTECRHSLGLIDLLLQGLVFVTESLEFRIGRVLAMGH